MKKINWFNCIIFIQGIIGICYLLNDFLNYGLIPLFSGTYYAVTYYGMFCDLFALLMVKYSFWYIIKHINKKCR